MKRRIAITLCFLCLFVMIDRGVGKILETGINQYFGLAQQAQILLIGHSHLMLAVDKQGLELGTGKNVSKYCREGVNVFDKFEMTKQYMASRYSDSLQYVIYSVDPFMFTGKGLSKDSYKLFYPFMNDEVMDDYVRLHAKNEFDYWIHKLVHTTRYNDPLINSTIRGFRKDWNNYKYGQLDVSDIEKKKHWQEIGFEPDLIQAFEETLQLLLDKNIHVILINTPIAEPLRNNEPEKYQRIIACFEEKAQNPLVDYWDYSEEYSMQYELFFDFIHLNPKGQEVITARMISDLNQVSN